MPSVKKYDLIFGMGRACACSQALRRAGLQLLSFPWDWIALDRPSGPDVLFRASTICEGFHDWFSPADLVAQPTPDGSSKTIYASRSTHVVYIHDFPKAVAMEKAFPEVKAKYERRLERLRQMIGASKKVLAVCIDMPGLCAPTSLDDIRAARERLSRHFTNASFDFAFISYEKGVPFAERRVETTTDGILHVAFDYKDYTPGRADHAVELDRLAEILRERFAVREYRTRAEIAAQKRRMRQAKMREAGVETMFQYRMRHLRRHWAKLALAASPRLAWARLRQKKFGHVVALGSSCEPAYRFWWRWGFVESSLFSWTGCDDLAMLVGALRNLDSFCAGELEFMPVYLWKCGNTGMRIHGRIKKIPGQPPPTEEILAADRADLVGRVGYLRQKFIRQATDDESTLFVYRLTVDECTRPDLAANLDALEDALRALGARNWKLLLIAERRVAALVPGGEGRFIRSVRAFNPTNGVTRPELGDPVGWKAVFTEFAPEKVVKSAKRFKFES